jgi:hypothetical protein
MFPLPDDIGPLQLAMLAVNPPTAWNMLQGFVALKPGDWVLQNAGSSSVGYNVIRLARRLGARTVNVVRREDQVAPLRSRGAMPHRRRSISRRGSPPPSAGQRSRLPSTQSPAARPETSSTRSRRAARS